MDFLILAQSSDSGAAGAIGGIIGLVIGLAIAAVMIASIWKVFEKAGEPGWAAIVPIYNLVVMVKIADRPIWWVALFFVPIANAIVPFIIYIDIAKKFGKSALWGIGLVLLPIVFFPMLGFGSAAYGGGAAQY